MIKNTPISHEDARARAHCIRQTARLIYATYHGDLLTALDAMANGANPNARDADGVPVLVAALSLHDTKHNNLEFLITELLHAGAQPDGGEKTASYTSPLAFAVEQEDTYILRCLLHAGANANAQDADGDTPLMRAAALGQINALSTLLAAGANATLRNKVGQTALDLALAHEEHDCALLLEQHLLAPFTATPRHPQSAKLNA